MKYLSLLIILFSINSFAITCADDEIDLNPGDVIYIASDGIRDQFGGERNKKLKRTGFEELLNSASKVPFNKRAKHIDSFLKEWQGDNYQVDDQSILCVKFSGQ